MEGTSKNFLVLCLLTAEKKEDYMLIGAQGASFSCSPIGHPDKEVLMRSYMCAARPWGKHQISKFGQ